MSVDEVTSRQLRPFTQCQSNAGRVVDTERVTRLAVRGYLVKHQDVILQGPIGAGKTCVACVLANEARQQYRKVLYLPASELFDRITIAERTDQKKRCLDALVKVELLIIDFVTIGIDSETGSDLFSSLVDREHKAATIIASQTGPTQWAEEMPDRIAGDSIVNRLDNNAKPIQLGSIDMRHIQHQTQQHE